MNSLHKTGSAFVKTLEVAKGVFVDVTYNFVDGVLRISDTWVRFK